MRRLATTSDPGSAGGYPTGAPTDPDKHDSCIRFLGITASRSSENDGNHFTTHPGSGYPLVFRAHGPPRSGLGRVAQQRLRVPTSPFPTHRLASGRLSLLSTGTMKTLRLPSPFPPASFPSPSVPRAPAPGGFGISHVPRQPSRRFALLSDPGRAVTAGLGATRAGRLALRRRVSSLALSVARWVPSSSLGLRPRRSGTAPAFLNNGDPNNKPDFEARSHGFSTRCLRFMPPLPTTMQDSLPAGSQPLPGGLDFPLGCDERFMSKRRTVLLSWTLHGAMRNPG